MYVRDRLGGRPPIDPLPDPLVTSVNTVIDGAMKLQYGLLAMFGNRFPVFRVANASTDINKLAARNEQVHVRIHYRQGEWFIADELDDARLFSFDLPNELYELYAESGRLDMEKIANIELWAQQLRDKFEIE